MLKIIILSKIMLINLFFKILKFFNETHETRFFPPILTLRAKRENFYLNHPVTIVFHKNTI